MALTRKLLRSLGIDDEKIETIIDAHGETVEALKKERDDYKAEAVKVEEMTKQLNDANDKLAKSGDAAKVQADFDAYKAEVAGEKTRTAKRNAVNEALKNAGVTRDSFREMLLKTWDMDGVEMDENGTAKNAAEIETKIKTEYADFISTTTTGGTPPVTPPTGGNVKMTRQEIMNIKDTAARQKAIAENLEAFGK